MQAQVQIMPYNLMSQSTRKEKPTLDLKSIQIEGFEQTSAKFIEVFIL